MYRSTCSSEEVVSIMVSVHVMKKWYQYSYINNDNVHVKKLCCNCSEVNVVRRGINNGNAACVVGNRN